MEAIASAASVLTLIGAAITTSREILILVQISRKAPVHINRLATELTDLHGILETFKGLLAGKGTESDLTVIKMLDNLREVLANCVKVLLDVKRIVSHFLDHSGGVVAGRWQAFVWATFKRDEVSTLQETLSSYKAMLNLSLGALSTLYGAHTDKMMIKIDANTSQNQNTLQHIQKAVRRLQQQVDNRDREEALRDRRLQENESEDSNRPCDSSIRSSAPLYNRSLRMSLRDLDSIISSSPASSRAPSMTVSVDPGSSVPSVASYITESKSPWRDLECLTEEERKLFEPEKSTEMVTLYQNPSLIPPNEINDERLLSRPDISPFNCEGRDYDGPAENGRGPTTDTERDVHQSVECSYPAFKVKSGVDKNDPAKDIGTEPQPPQPHPSTPLVPFSTISTLHRQLEAVPFRGVYEHMKESLQHRVEDWKKCNLKEFGKLLLFDVLVVFVHQKLHAHRFCEVYLFERILLCCKAKGFNGIHYSLVTSAQLPKIQLKGGIFTRDLVSAAQEPLKEDAILHVVWRNEGVMLKTLELFFHDWDTMVNWKGRIEECIDLHT